MPRSSSYADISLQQRAQADTQASRTSNAKLPLEINLHRITGESRVVLLLYKRLGPMPDLIPTAPHGHVSNRPRARSYPVRAPMASGLMPAAESRETAQNRASQCRLGSSPVRQSQEECAAWRRSFVAAWTSSDARPVSRNYYIYMLHSLMVYGPGHKKYEGEDSERRAGLFPDSR